MHQKDTDSSVDRYLKEICNIPLLTVDQEIQLARRIRNDDQEALEALTKANLRFVVSVAKHYQNRGLSLGDLINEGNLGLIKAAKRFDESRGFKFISYAVWWIRQSILTALAEHTRVVRLPLNRIGNIHKIGKTLGDLEQTFGRNPSAMEVAEELGMSLDEVFDALKISRKHLSLDAPLGEGYDNQLFDVIPNDQQQPPDDILLNESLRIELERALKKLTTREAEIIKLYFGLEGKRPLNLEEIGIRFSLTRERIRQIKEKAIRKLRYSSRCQRLQSYQLD